MEIKPGKTTRVYQCEDSIEGILSGIYQAWDAAYGHEFIRLSVPALEDGQDALLFCEYRTAGPDPEQAGKVARTIRDKVSISVYENIIRALLSNNPGKADAVYHMLPLAFKVGEGVLGHLADPYVQAVFGMNRHVGNEAHRYLQFLRFEELGNGVMLAKFQPNCDLLEVVTPHFEDRFPQENFIIYDTGRGKASFHRGGCPFLVRQVTEAEMAQFSENSGNEKMFQSLWKLFFDSIAVEERKNEKLQKNLLPLHYRRYMTEWNI